MCHKNELLPAALKIHSLTELNVLMRELDFPEEVYLPRPIFEMVWSRSESLLHGQDIKGDFIWFSGRSKIRPPKQPRIVDLSDAEVL